MPLAFSRFSSEHFMWKNNYNNNKGRLCGGQASTREVDYFSMNMLKARSDLGGSQPRRQQQYIYIYNNMQQQPTSPIPKKSRTRGLHPRLAEHKL